MKRIKYIAKVFTLFLLLVGCSNWPDSQGSDGLSLHIANFIVSGKWQAPASEPNIERWHFKPQSKDTKFASQLGWQAPKKKLY